MSSGNGVRELAAGAGGLLVTAVLGAVALVSALPVAVPTELAWRLPLLLAAAGLGGRLHVDGPAAGHVSALSPGGLLDPADVGGPARHLTVTAVPSTLTAIVLVAVLLAARRGPRWSPGRSVAVPLGLAALGGLLAALSRVDVSGGTVGVGVLGSALGGAAVGAVAVVLTGLVRTLPVATAVAYGRALLVVGGPVLVLVACCWGLGLVGTVLVGGPMPAGLGVVLALLLAPTLVWFGVGFALGSPLTVHARLAGIDLDRSLTVLGAARSVPALAFLPVLVAVVLLVLALRSPAHRGLGTDGWTGPPGRATAAAAHVLAMFGLALSVGAVGRLGLHSERSGGERFGVAPAWWATLLLPVVWGVVLATLSGSLTGVRDGRRAIAGSGVNSGAGP